MWAFIAKRVVGMVPVLFIIATATFFFIRLAPGGPFDSDRSAPPEILKNIEAKYHLDEPLWQQYGRYMASLAEGDLGPSFRYANRSVNEIIADSFPYSAAFGLAGLLYALVLGITSGLVAATRPNTWVDYAPMSLSILGVCLPSFVIGPLLILVFAVLWPVFDVAGFDGPTDVVLPAITLGTAYAAYFSRLTRAGMLEILRADFIRTARAKGLSTPDIVIRHAMRGGLLPSVSFFGPAMAGVLTGSLVVETIFNIPGLGRLFVQSALNRDYTLVMGTVLFYAALILVFNLLVDVAYAWLDPRVSYET